jgi:PhzF family phenazine biosynthesis protein
MIRRPVRGRPVRSRRERETLAAVAGAEQRVFSYSDAVSRPIQHVDVFTSTPYGGNPVAVVLDSQGLSAEDMQRFARWMDFSETTFVGPPTRPGADYVVRIFTPSTELPFAGHPTLGTAHAWLSSGGASATDVIVQECGIGLVEIRRTAGGLAFAAPPLVRSGPADEPLVEELAAVLRIDRADVVAAEWVDNGPPWVAVLLDSAEAVLSLRPGDAGERYVGVVGPYPSGSPCAIEVRGFFPKGGATAEDPVTGSLNASLAQWLLGTGRVAAPYVAAQGTALGRSGRVHVTVEDGTIWIGGGTVTCVAGAVEL